MPVCLLAGSNGSYFILIEKLLVSIFRHAKTYAVIGIGLFTAAAESHRHGAHIGFIVTASNHAATKTIFCAGARAWVGLKETRCPLRNIGRHADGVKRTAIGQQQVAAHRSEER